MKLITKELEGQIPKLYSTENIPNEDKVFVVKFFTPDSNWTWYVVEGEQREDDWLFFGYVEGFEQEWGYFKLSELMKARGPLGLEVERDIHWKPTKYRDVMRKEV